jgi:hypothetical protein
VAELAGAALLLCACGSGGRRARPTPPIPQAQTARAATAGTALLAWLPAGADVVIEIDLARVRANTQVGPALGRVAAALAGRDGGEPVAWHDADLIVMASYGVGTEAAATVTLVRGRLSDRTSRGARLADGTVVLGPPREVDRVVAAAAAAAQTAPSATMAGDERFLRLRDAAMPAGAAAASLRGTALLSFDARVTLARLCEVDAAPVAVALWGDVADDLAVVLLLAGDRAADGAALADEVRAWRTRLAGAAQVQRWFLGHVVRRIDVEAQGDLVRATLVVGPRALARIARRLASE